MKKYEEEKLLDGVQKHDYMQFWEINQPLNDKHIADMKKYAIRIFSNVYQNYVLPNFEIDQYQDETNQFENKEDYVYSPKFTAWEQSSYDITLGSLLQKAFPGLFEAEEETKQVVAKKNF